MQFFLVFWGHHWGTGTRPDSVGTGMRSSGISPGDEIFVMLSGSKAGRSLIGHGYATGPIFESPHPRNPAKLSNWVNVTWETWIDEGHGMPLEDAAEAAPNFYWRNPQGGGIRIEEGASLKKAWNQFVTELHAGAFEPPSGERLVSGYPRRAEETERFDAEVQIDFSEPVPGPDTRSGGVIRADRHYLKASAASLDLSETLFVRASGEIAYGWPTQKIRRITWLKGGGEGLSARLPITNSPDTPSEQVSASETQWFEISPAIQSSTSDDPGEPAKLTPSRPKLRDQLESWRSEQALHQDKRSSAILSNAAIGEIVSALPRSMDELQTLPGVKLRPTYGFQILRLIDEAFVAGGAALSNAPLNDLANESSGETVSSAAHRLFGLQISASGRFERQGWFHVGTTVVRCLSCSSPLEGFRAPYRSAAKTYHYWALVCTKCSTLIAPADLAPKDRLSLYDSSELRPTVDEVGQEESQDAAQGRNLKARGRSGSGQMMENTEPYRSASGSGMVRDWSQRMDHDPGPKRFCPSCDALEVACKCR